MEFYIYGIYTKNAYFQEVSKDRYDHITDNELLEKFYSDHDNQWLGIVLQRYTLLLLGVCMKYLKNEEEAKDAVQQIFLKAITELAKYKVSYIKSWLYMVARNHCLMKLRDKGKYPVEINEKAMAATDDPGPELTAIEKEQQLSSVWHRLHYKAKEVGG